MLGLGPASLANVRFFSALPHFCLLSVCRLLHLITHFLRNALRRGLRVATFRKTATGWRAEVCRNRVRRSKSFATKRAAQDWAAQQVYEIDNRKELSARVLLREVFERYAREVSPTKRGHRWEVVRLEKLGRDALASLRIGDVGPTDLGAWRDRRLAEVSPASVIREMKLLSAVFETARGEWQMVEANPVRDVRKPKGPPARSRLPLAADFERLALSAGDDLSHATARAYHAFLFGCESAMRAGEICGLTWDRIDIDQRLAVLPMTKNGHPRDVPLSSEAVRLLQQLPHSNPVFGLTTAQLDVLWRKLRTRAAVEDLHFHDSRAEALTRWSRRVDVMTLARISGHRDLNMLLNTYYRETAADIAKRMDQS